MQAEQSQELRISWSRIRTREECAARDELARAGHKSKIANVRQYYHGQVADLAMRRWLGQDEPEPGQMASWVATLMDETDAQNAEEGGRVRWRHLRDREEVAEFVTELVTRLEPLLQRYVVPFDYQPALRFDVPFTVPYLDGSLRVIRLVGEMDVTVKDAGRYYVFDLKATRDGQYWRKTLAQLTFYDIACACLFGVFTTGTGLLQPMCAEPFKLHRVDDQSRRELQGRIVRVAHGIWRGDDRPKPGSYCRECPVHHACPLFATAGGRTAVSLQ